MCRRTACRDPRARRRRVAGARRDGLCTLEPCCHHGRTPPCSAALVRAGIARVVAAMPDPNPRVARQGIADLEKAGIRVDIGLLQAESEHLNPVSFRV